MRRKIAIQGVRGAFHDIVAHLYYESDEVEIIPCNTFDEVLKNVISGDADNGIMAIENSVAGSILPNYNLLREIPVAVIGEVYLRIEQNLIVLPGQKMEDIKEVCSHPMALLQCRSFFEQHPKIKLTEAVDTALMVKLIRDENMLGYGAIASEYSAKIYDMEILAAGIESNKQNYTRFLVLQKKNQGIKLVSPEKVSLCFNTPHEVGSLSKVLSVLSYYNINLTKIQSLPILGCEWEYLFYIDLEFADYNRYLQSVEAIRPLTENLKILGEYTKGKKHYENISVN
jgi:prephenate dehydratase